MYQIETYPVDSTENDKLLIDYNIEKEKAQDNEESDLESEDSKSSTDDYRKENELLKKYLEEEHELNPNGSDEIDKLFSKINQKKDDNFDKYKKMTSSYPKQVIRYCRNPGTEPLWISDKSIPDLSKVSNCLLCQGKRIFECQINSQILNLYPELTLLDWGVIAIYTY